MTGDLRRQSREDDARLNGLARRLDKPMGILGLIFLLLVLAQAFVHDEPLSTVLTVTSWVLWAVFVVEFALRAWLARHCAGEFWKHHWWQLIFLAVPFLRFLRAASALRAARGGGVVAAAVRGSRSAGWSGTARPVRHDPPVVTSTSGFARMLRNPSLPARTRRRPESSPRQGGRPLRGPPAVVGRSCGRCG
ncbi:hypothetical protein [Micromonospora sp. ATA51]|uniref:hypothetical protein n=1 Tax=Micromonospora sp. ATA51 TaxID=2806098 RepID=UPI001A5F1CF8|nr:hypothetical protein [Micromonospora sp. ATA51]MBM0224760.1 hypothetical protein [Micromonospora sp. ATA51]